GVRGRVALDVGVDVLAGALRAGVVGEYLRHRAVLAAGQENEAARPGLRLLGRAPGRAVRGGLAAIDGRFAHPGSSFRSMLQGRRLSVGPSPSIGRTGVLREISCGPISRYDEPTGQAGPPRRPVSESAGVGRPGRGLVAQVPGAGRVEYADARLALAAP